MIPSLLVISEEYNSVHSMSKLSGVLLVIFRHLAYGEVENSHFQKNNVDHYTSSLSKQTKINWNEKIQI